jgi:HK97 family phage major capsid protein
MDRIRQLQAERDERRTKIAAILHAAEKDKRSLTPDEKLSSELEAAALQDCEAKLGAEYKQLEYDRTAAPMDWPGSIQGAPPPGATRASGKLSYRSLFGEPKRSEAFKDEEDFFSAVGSGRYHPGLIQAGMTEGTPADGGFLVPEQLTAEAFDAAVEDSVFLPRCRVYPMTSETRGIAGIDAAGNATYGPYGTWAPSWVGEAGSIGESSPKTRKVELKAHKLGLYIKVSNELLADGLTLSEQLGTAMKKALGWALDYAIARGTGVGQPLGIVAAPATVTVSKETGQAADTFVSANALAMYSRMLPAGHRNAAWFIHPTVLPQLYSMTVAAGVAGQALGGLPGYFDASAMTLFGRPVVVTEKLAALGDLADVLFADLSFFALGIRKEITLDSSVHIGFQTDEVAYRGIVRADGKPLLDAAYKPKSGSTLSPFVILEARA